MPQHRNPHIPPDQPHTVAFPITPSDTQRLVDFTWGIYIGGAGDLHVDMLDGGNVTLKGLLAGTIYPLQIKRVFATGTTATNLVGLY